MKWLFANWYVIVPVLYMVFYILRIVRKAKRGSGQETIPAEAEFFESEDIEEDDEAKPVFVREMPKPAVQAAKPAEKKPAAVPLAVLSGKVSSGGREHAAEPRAACPRKTALSPMQKAVAWAEILGPPKGL
jgi:hypothetical protein